MSFVFVFSLFSGYCVSDFVIKYIYEEGTKSFSLLHEDTWDKNASICLS